MAESHLEFADAELDAGKYFPAKREVAVCEENAHRALELSPKDRCNPPPPPKPLDTDGDGIPDKLDKCPTEPEDKDGFEDADGCPDPDNDKDGILDKADKCPNEPEDKDGFEDEDGCPDPDNDKDGILDADDKCPNEPGPKENGGCPDNDKDGDGVVDRLDKCPISRARPTTTAARSRSTSWSPRRRSSSSRRSTSRPTRHDLPRLVPHAHRGRRGAKVAPEIKVRIEGHTDSRGTLKHNMKLSRGSRRAPCKQFLVGHGVEAERMESRGFGPTQPIDDNRTSKGREANRRTEFIITSQ